MTSSLILSTARVVQLAGRDFYVAPLSLRQILAVADYVPKLSGLTAENMSGERLSPLAEVLWHGLRRAHPNLTRDEFFDLPIPIGELVAALPVVIEQAGGRKGELRARGNCRRRALRNGRVESARRRTRDRTALDARKFSTRSTFPFLSILAGPGLDCPPLRKLLAAYLGHKPRPRSSKNYHELLAMFPNGRIN